TEAVGLYNLGQSCCLNSLLQVFLMNIRFTGILRRITVPSSPAQRRNNVPYQMLLLLEKMQCGKCKAVGPTDLACCLSEHRVKLFVQHDAAQLFLTLWNLLKKQMKKPELVEELSDLYIIRIQEHLACQKCSFEMKSNSTMLTLPLPVLDANSQRLKTLENCLQYFFHPEELTGQNMCFCQQCGRKTTFLQVIGELFPHVSYPDLPLGLGRVGKGLNHISLRGDQQLRFMRIAALRVTLCVSLQATWQYELFAVVAHSGSTSCGHYCAYIRSLTEHKWYCFNDSEVCQVSWDDVKCTYGHCNLYW
ncbi:UBP18 hydrolase, partial [Ptilorrhoa leucosticta]|nr:UBP18 hydrolase [Ptilorrhoa leucosticta]